MSLFLFLRYQDLFGREMGLAQWQVYGEDATLHIVTVGCFDGTVVHLNHHLAEVQTNTRSLYMH